MTEYSSSGASAVGAEVPEPSPGQSISSSREARPVIVMLTFNQRESTVRALDSVRAHAGPGVGVVVWDNASTDGTAEAVPALFQEVLYYRHSENVGVASGRNGGARLAIEQLGATHLLFLDNDMIITSGFVEALLEPFMSSHQVAQTQAKIRFLREPDRINYGGGCNVRFWLGDTSPVCYGEVDRGQCDRPVLCIPNGGGMLVRADVFQRLEGFDAIFDPYGPEDLDFSLRVRRSGMQSWYVPKALVYHEVGRTFEGGRATERYTTHRARHWLLFMRRHASLMEQLGFLFVGAPYRTMRIAIREGIRGNVMGIRGFVRGAFEALQAARSRTG